LYGWSLILGKEHRLRVSENRMLRRIFGPKREEVVGDWRRLHNEERRNLYVTPNIIRMIKSRMRWEGHVICMGEMRFAYKIFVGKPERKRPIGRPRRRWKNNIIMDLRQIALEGVEWIHLAQDRDQWRAIMNTVKYLRVPQKEGNFLTS
jgi:hypothetical protein